MSGTIISTPRLKLEPLEQWGKLVKSWATRLDYIDKPKAPSPPVDLPFGEQPPRDFWVRDYPPPGPNAAIEPDTDVGGTPKTWALPTMSSVDVLHADGTKVSLPAAVALTRQEFLDRLTAARVMPKELPDFDQVIIVQGAAKTMVLRLPPRDILQGAEDDLLHGKPYEIPDFYLEVYKAVPGPDPQTVVFVPPTLPDKIMELHAYRIGEYTLNSCN